jgi:hypothetical protein
VFQQKLVGSRMKIGLAQRKQAASCGKNQHAFNGFKKSYRT